MFFLSHLIYSFSVIYGNTQSLFYELFYELILNPKLELITITVDGADHNFSKTVTFVGGKRHTLTATLSKEGGGLSVSISAWESDGVDYGGVAS